VSQQEFKQLILLASYV